MVPDERSSAGFLSIVRLHSIKSKIIVFALIATIIPSLTMGWVSYVNNRQFLDEKIAQELYSITSHTSRELDLWLKERLYETRVFSSSYVVSENLEKIFDDKVALIEKKMAHRRVREYLKSVREKFIDYEEFMVVDTQGNIMATSFEKQTGVIMPQNWLQKAKTGESIIGNPTWDEPLKAGIMVIAVPIVTVQERLLGVLVAKLNFRTIDQILKNYTIEETGELYLITKKGTVLISSQPISSVFMGSKLSKQVIDKLLSHRAGPVDYENYRGIAVVGTLRMVPRLSWGVVAEKEMEKAYAQIFRLRNLTIGFFSGLVLAIGLVAYLIGLNIVRPLNRLIRGADKVAAGDLEVDLPVHSRGELGFMTKVFNHMVARLRQGRDELATVNQTLRQRNKELHELSITDSLTGLYNHKHLMETLVREVRRSKRHQHPFAVLMMDIDHFKRFNDTYGHLAGDEVLRKMATIFRDSVRGCDYVARYGGEEFLIMLPETGSDRGVQTAERIRNQMAEEKFVGDGKTVTITISVGVAVFPEHANFPKSLVSSADTALYKAKKGGRNQVVLGQQVRDEQEAA